ncbi:MAG: LysM peptidoglycan-binding domain-containing protein, partial [Ilumatobacteraceae bacterium]
MLLANNRFGARFATALVSVAAVIVGLPALLVAVALRRFDHLSPLTGMKAPWRWSVADLRSWAKHLTEGLDSSAALVDIFFRVALIIGWICVVVVVYTLVAETTFQVRHGMPSVGHRRLGGLGGLGMLGRKVAAVLVSVLPLAISVSPALAGSHVVGPVAAVVAHRAPDLDDPIKQTLTMPVEDPFATVSTLGAGWSVVEVKRGDSVWAIADRIAGERDVAIVAQQIVAANLGTMMSDGHRFSTPALIEPGWLLDVPVDAGSIVASTSPIQPTSVEASSPIQTDGVHVVVAGDSYWRIAEEQLDPSAADHEIALYTAELMSINAPLLGYADARLIRPGDTVALPTAEPSVTGASAVPDPRIDAPVAQPAPVPVAASAVLPPIVVSLPPPVDVEPVAVAVDGPTVASTPEVSTVDNRPNEGFPLSRGLAAAVLLSGGAIAALEARRRQQLRSAGVGARLLLPTGEAAKTEMLLRLLSAEDRLARLDLALRSAAPDLARQHARVLAAEVADDGEIRLYTDRPALSLASRWLLDVEEGTWRLPGDVTLAELAESGRGANQPCPAILHVGESAGGQLFVDLEAVGVLSVDAPSAVAASIVRCAVASLAVSPFAESSRVFTVGVGIEAHLGSPNFESTESLAAAADAVRATVGSITPATVGDVSTFGLRATACGGEAWEPTLLLAIGAEDRQGLEALLSLAGGGG